MMEERIKLMLNFKTAMMWSGLWARKFENQKFIQSIYLLYSIAMQATFSLMFFGSLANISEAFSEGDYPGVIDNIWMSLITSVILTKMVAFQRKDFSDFILRSITEEARIYREEPQVSQDILNENYKVGKKITTLVAVCTMSSGILICTCNTIVYFQYRHLNETELKPTMTPHIQYPFNRHKYFLETYLISLGSICSGTVFCILSQAYFIALTSFVISQLKIIKEISRKFDVYNGTECTQEDVLAVFRKIYYKHLYIIDFVGELNMVIKHLILMECVVNSIIIAFVIVQLLFVASSVTSITLYVAVSCTVLSQIFVMSWIANEIEVESLAISDALFDSRWWEQTQKVKQIISIIMMRSRRPLRIMIGPFYPLTIETALNSLRTAYSYIALIFAMSENGQLQI